jgi:hypothetical protein
MASRLVPVTADKVLDLWKAGLVVSSDGHPWRKWDSMGAGETLFDTWKDRTREMVESFYPCVLVEEDVVEGDSPNEKGVARSECNERGAKRSE